MIEETIKEVLSFEESFFKDKMKILSAPELSRQEAFNKFTQNQAFWYHFIHEYDMDFVKYGDKFILRTSLSPAQNKFVQAIVKELCTGTNLKPNFTLIGKSAEMTFRNCINSLFNLFRIKKRMQLNYKKYTYGGDGGGDFFLGTKVFDIKYRNDSPAHGMILDQSFLNRTQDDVILIHVTNSVSYQLSLKEDLGNQELPLAISGWITVREFKEKGKSINNGRGSSAVDNLHPIQDLLFEILKEQLEAEELFTYE